jgi:hypothetical protein
MPQPPYAFLISTTPHSSSIRHSLGAAAYSYHFVAEALTPVLGRLGVVTPIDCPESRLAAAARAARGRGLAPLHLAVLPIQDAYIDQELPNIFFPFWEFPDLPDRALGGDPRQDWVRIANRADLILVACGATAEAFTRSRVSTPVATVPVPLPGWVRSVAPWSSSATVTLECGWTSNGGPNDTSLGSALTQDESVIRKRAGALFRQVAPWLPPECVSSIYGTAQALRSHSPGAWATMSARALYKRLLREWLSERAIERVTRVKESLCARIGISSEAALDPILPRRTLELSGLVYTTFLAVGDPRKNYHDLISGFLYAFRDDPNATLVIKLATNPRREHHELGILRAYHAGLGIEHRCRIVVITDYLDDAQLSELLRATTYYVNTSFAEGACLPLQNALAAGRPAIAPDHSAMRDTMDSSIGFVIGSDPEPCAWPHDPDQRLTTYRGRICWSDLRDHLVASAELVRDERDRYHALSDAARRRLTALASTEAATEAMSRALARLGPGAGQRAA